MDKNERTNCTRCQGKGYGDWAPEFGKCHGCQGKGTRAAQIAIREAAKQAARISRERERVSILVGPVVDRHAAQIAYFEAFVGTDRSEWAYGPVFEAVAPGWYAGTEVIHVETVLEDLAKESNR